MIDFKDLPPMEIKCAECDGVGRYATQDNKGMCRKCWGKGKLLTSFGEALVTLIENHSPWKNELDRLRERVYDLES